MKRRRHSRQTLCTGGKKRQPSHNSSIIMEAGSGGMSIEQMDQKKSQLEHILLRPDSYIGSVEFTKELMWFW
ncbi:hypothetical protein KR059_012961 [Drosophila kikkawai]|nr:hypothetical protein KR059_012961 [Drosophila kikkawai]